MKEALQRYGRAVSARLTVTLDAIADPAVRDAVKAALGQALAYSAIMGATVSPQSAAMRLASLVVASDMARLGLLPDVPTDASGVSVAIPGPGGAQ